MIALWQLRPVLHRHVLWERKSNFLYEVDTYERWVAYAVESGICRYRIGGEEGTAGGGDLLVCPAGTPFHRSVVTPLSFHFIVFDWTTINGEPSSQDKWEHMLPTGKIRLVDKGYLLSALAHLRSLDRHHESWNLTWKNHLIEHIWLMYCAEREASSREDSMVTNDPLMEEAAQFIRQKALGPLNLKQVSSHFGLSPSRFSKRFFAAYDKTPMDYLIAIRLKHACRLLQETDLTLNQIAERCGYENGYYVSRLFTEKMKITTSEFRKLNRL